MSAALVLIAAIICLNEKKPVVQYGDANIVPVSITSPLYPRPYISGLEAFEILSYQTCYDLNNNDCKSRCPYCTGSRIRPNCNAKMACWSDCDKKAKKACQYA
jgi:hypothetical protein